VSTHRCHPVLLQCEAERVAVYVAVYVAVIVAVYVAVYVVGVAVHYSMVQLRRESTC